MRSFNSHNQDFLHGLRIGVAVIVSMALLGGIGGLPVENVMASPSVVITDFYGDAVALYQVFREIIGDDRSHFDPPSTVATAAVQFDVGPTDTGEAAAFQNARGINAVEASSNFGGARQARFDASTSFSVDLRSTVRPSHQGIPITFKFVINGGELRIENFAGLDADASCGFCGADVFAQIVILFARTDVFGRISSILSEDVWRFHLILTKDSSGNPLVRFGLFNQDDFGVGTPNVHGPFFDGDAVFVTIDRFEAEFPIGTLESRNLLQVVYDMSAEVDVEGSGPIGGLAAIGDPFSLSSGGGGNDVGGQLFVNGMDLGQIPFGQPPSSVPVEIDIKPGSDANPINPASQGVIPVAILTTSINDGDSADFDAITVDALSVAFGPNGATEAHATGHIEDADGDGDDDLVLHFRTQETGIQCGDTQVVLTGETFDGQSVEGVDVVNTAGC